MIGNSLRLMGRNVLQNSIRFSGSHGGVPGENLPFSINNRYKLTALYVVFFSSGFGLPFILVRHQLLKT